MRRAMTLMMLALMMLAAPVAAMAMQGAESTGEGFLFRADGDVVIGQNETVSAVIVASGDARVSGEVTDVLLVIDGTARVEGTVRGEIVVIEGALELAAPATVENVTLVRSTLDQASGATITGDTRTRTDLVSFGWGAAVFSMLMWLGVSLALVIGAVVFAAVGGRQLREMGEVLRGNVGMSVLTAFVVWIGAPVVAVLLMATVIGIPLGVGILLFVLPVLWLLGYLVAGTEIGRVLLGALNMTEGRYQLIVAAAAGVALLQLVSLAPGVGPLVAVLAAIVGSGALVYRLVGQPGRPGRAAQSTPAVQPRPAE